MLPSRKQTTDLVRCTVRTFGFVAFSRTCVAGFIIMISVLIAETTNRLHASHHYFPFFIGNRGMKSRESKNDRPDVPPSHGRNRGHEEPWIQIWQAWCSTFTREKPRHEEPWIQIWKAWCSTFTREKPRREEPWIQIWQAWCSIFTREKPRREEPWIQIWRAWCSIFTREIEIWARLHARRRIATGNKHTWWGGEGVSTYCWCPSGLF